MHGKRVKDGEERFRAFFFKRVGSHDERPRWSCFPFTSGARDGSEARRSRCRLRASRGRPARRRRAARVPVAARRAVPPRGASRLATGVPTKRRDLPRTRGRPWRRSSGRPRRARRGAGRPWAARGRTRRAAPARPLRRRRRTTRRRPSWPRRLRPARRSAGMRPRLVREGTSSIGVLPGRRRRRRRARRRWQIRRIRARPRRPRRRRRRVVSPSACTETPADGSPRRGPRVTTSASRRRARPRVSGGGCGSCRPAARGSTGRER